MLLSRSRSRGASRRSWRRIGCKCCHAEAEHRREQKNNFVHDFDKQLLRFSHVCLFPRSFEKSGVAPNQPIRVTCGRQKPTFGRSRLCRSRSRSQRLLHSPLPGEFGVALTHVTSHDETQETYGSFEINFKRSSRSSRSPRSSRREFHNFKGARRHVWRRGKVAQSSCILSPGYSLLATPIRSLTPRTPPFCDLARPGPLWYLRLHFFQVSYQAHGQSHPLENPQALR